MKSKHFILSRIFKKDFLINQLMQLYSILLVLISIFIIGLICIYNGVEQFRAAANTVNGTSLQLDNYIKDKNSLVTNILSELTSSDQQIESLRNYLKMTPAEYFSYENDIFRQSGESLSIPNLLNRLLRTHPEITEILIQLEESPYYLKANSQAPYGEKINGTEIDLEGTLYLARWIAHPSNYAQPIGQIFITFNTQQVLNSQSERNAQYGIESFIYGSNGQRLFTDTSNLDPSELAQIDEAMRPLNVPNETILAKDFYVQKTVNQNEMTALVLLSKRVIWQSIAGVSFMILFLGAAVIALLLLILHRTFKRYTSQVEQIVASVKKVSHGDFEERIDTSQVQQELQQIAIAFNQMTASINAYIEDIYILEIKQRDANMRALQAQIDPHFLSNTLEYIRMYALNQGQEELADVVYAFSALLRNNTTQEKTTTLQQELDFCEKYVFLYQMRYPDKIAYHVIVEEKLKQLRIPKFVIQPLVENYFVHGIDYQRNDNAISIKARIHEGCVNIQILDNGKGVPAQKLSEIKEQLATSTVELQQSIGLKNVHERLRGYYGTRYQMTLDSQENGGFRINLLLDQEVLQND